MVWERLPVTANLNFWSRTIFWNLALPEKCTDPERKCMRTELSAETAENLKNYKVGSLALEHCISLRNVINFNEARGICRMSPDLSLEGGVWGRDYHRSFGPKDIIFPSFAMTVTVETVLQ